MSRTAVEPVSTEIFEHRSRGVSQVKIDVPSKWVRKRLPSDTTWHDTVPFVPPIECGLVIKVYDGDTITIASTLPYKGSRIYRFSVRLNGIDTPEMKTKDASEKAIAEKAQKTLSDMILGQWVTLKNTDNDKYGRLLADVWFQGTNMNQWMLDNRLAVPYDGGTKITPANWEVYYQNGGMNEEEEPCLFIEEL